MNRSVYVPAIPAVFLQYEGEMYVRVGWCVRLRLTDTESLRHFFVEKTLARTVRLHPFSVDDELRDGAFSGSLHDFVGRAGRGFDVDLLERNLVLLEKALGLAAVGTPGCGVDGDFHASHIISKGGHGPRSIATTVVTDGLASNEPC